jgi:hypothetical protein
MPYTTFVYGFFVSYEDLERFFLFDQYPQCYEQYDDDDGTKIKNISSDEGDLPIIITDKTIHINWIKDGTLIGIILSDHSTEYEDVFTIPEVTDETRKLIKDFVDSNPSFGPFKPQLYVEVQR